MSRSIQRICPGVGFATKFFPCRRRLRFDYADFPRADDALRCTSFRGARIFVFRNAWSGTKSRLARFRPQEIPLRPAGDLARDAVTLFGIPTGGACSAEVLCGGWEKSPDICFHDQLCFYDADHYDDR